MTNNDFMKKALHYAKLCLKDDEVPVGCVIVKDNEIISFGRNRRHKRQNVLMHAEIEAINRACKKLKSWRLCGCEMYVTLEPCVMCAGAIAQSRIEKVYIGAKDEKGGACGSMCDVLNMPVFYKSKAEFILSEECSSLLKNFFKSKRNKE